jgi:hypothetical protein
MICAAAKREDLPFLPKRPRGRPSLEADAAYHQQVAAFCTLILEIQSNNGFQGWQPWLVLHPRAPRLA